MAKDVLDFYLELLDERAKELEEIEDGQPAYSDQY